MEKPGAAGEDELVPATSTACATLTKTLEPAGTADAAMLEAVSRMRSIMGDARKSVPKIWEAIGGIGGVVDTARASLSRVAQ